MWLRQSFGPPRISFFVLISFACGPNLFHEGLAGLRGIG